MKLSVEQLKNLVKKMIRKEINRYKEENKTESEIAPRFKNWQVVRYKL